MRGKVRTSRYWAFLGKTRAVPKEERFLFPANEEAELYWARTRSGRRLVRHRDLFYYAQYAHMTPASVLPEHKKGRFQFCFVRKPLDWYRSYYCFRLKHGLSRRIALDFLWKDDFNAFLENVLRAYPDGFVTKVYQLYVGKKADQMDFVGRQESLGDDLCEALTLAGEEFDRERLLRLPPQNVTDPEYGSHAVASPGMTAAVDAAEGWILETFY